jgi:hypothetical protein
MLASLSNVTEWDKPNFILLCTFLNQPQQLKTMLCLICTYMGMSWNVQNAAHLNPMIQNRMLPAKYKRPQPNYSVGVHIPCFNALRSWPILDSQKNNIGARY